MTQEVIIQELNKIFQDTFNDDTISVAPETNADDIEEWDSISHVQLVFAIETAFDVKFTNQEILSLVDIGSIIALVSQKKAS